MSWPHIATFILSALLLGCGERPMNPVAPAVNNAAQTPAAPNEAEVSAVPPFLFCPLSSSDTFPLLTPFLF